MYADYYRQKIALVTGGGSGIGRELCLALAAAGALVVCTDIDEEKAAETALITGNGNITAQKLDVTKLSDFENVIDWTKEKYGRLDIIFNNAGVALTGEMRDIEISEWHKVFDVNFFGVLYGSQTAYAYMLKQGPGQIVNMASLAGLMDNMVLMGPYSVSKHAVVSYSKLLRIEAKALGIKVNTVCPGFIRTDIAINGNVANADDNWHERAKELVAIKGIGPAKAARYILEKVSRNKGLIVFPWVYKPLWWFSSWFKRISRLIVSKNLREFRSKHRLSNGK